MLRRFPAALLIAATALGATLGSASECPPTARSARVMLHDPALLAARLTTLGEAPRTHAGRAAVLRKLFEAAGCTEIAEHGGGDRRNVECIVRGASDDVIVVGVNQRYDSLGSAALLSSLAESLAAAPRKHTFRYVAFSAHETLIDPANPVRKPKGAMRWLAALDAARRSRVHAMIHLGPIGFGALATHPDQAEQRLACPLEDAAKTAGVELSAPRELDDECVRNGLGPLITSVRRGTHLFSDCRPRTNRSGSHDWDPFRRRGVPIFGVHSSAGAKYGGEIESAIYLKSYRALAIFLALADEALAGSQPDSALQPVVAAAPQ